MIRSQLGPKFSLSLVAVLICSAAFVLMDAASTTTRTQALVPAGSSLRVNVPAATGGKTVLGQLTVDRVTQVGFVTAYGCDDGIPRNAQGQISKSDLNYNGTVDSISSNRLIVKADNDGDICFYTSSPAEMIIDVNGITDTAITPLPNQRTDTRPGATTTTTTTTVPKPGNPGDTKNCSDFANYAQAKAWFDTYFPYYGDIAKLDRDDNGIPCETLPGAP